MAVVDRIKWLYRVFGLSSLWATGKDAWLIILARCCRMFAFGTNALVLALFFSALEFTDWSIGLFMTLTLLGDVVLSLVLTLIADSYGRRRVLLGGSLLMVASGVAFAIFENYWILLLAAVVGVMSATGGDYGPFRAIEESMLSQLTTPATRADVLSWYILISRVGSSIGAEAAGRTVDFLDGLEGWTTREAYHMAFWVYSAMGVVNFILVFLLSDRCEVAPEPKQEENEMLMVDGGQHREGSDDESDDDTGMPRAPVDPIRPKTVGFFSGFSFISGATRAIMYKLWFLLIVDSLADGMVSYSLTNYYLDQKFHMSKSLLGHIASASFFLACFSLLFAAPLTQFLGLVKTMVYTHVPSSAAVLFFPIPQGIPMTVVLLLIRTGLNDMDQAPRSALIAAVVKPEERTAVMGITGMLRTLAASSGPTVTGLLSSSNYFWVAFVAAGILRLAYDFGLFAIFVNMKLHQHEQQDSDSDATAVERHSSDEEARIPGAKKDDDVK